MNNDTVIRVKNLGKRCRLGTTLTHDTLRERSPSHSCVYFEQDDMLQLAID